MEINKTKATEFITKNEAIRNKYFNYFKYALITAISLVGLALILLIFMFTEESISLLIVSIILIIIACFFTVGSYFIINKKYQKILLIDFKESILSILFNDYKYFKNPKIDHEFITNSELINIPENLLIKEELAINEQNENTNIYSFEATFNLDKNKKVCKGLFIKFNINESNNNYILLKDKNLDQDIFKPNIYLNKKITSVKSFDSIFDFYTNKEELAKYFSKNELESIVELKENYFKDLALILKDHEINFIVDNSINEKAPTLLDKIDENIIFERLNLYIGILLLRKILNK